MSRVNIVSVCVFLLLIWNDLSQVTVKADVKDVIGNWADNFGAELWQMAQAATKMSEIKARYKSHNVRIEKKDGKKLLTEIVDNVEAMMKYKMDAIKCIMEAVEREAAEFDPEDRTQNYTYYSSKCSTVEETKPEADSEICMHRDMYREMSLTPLRQFYNIPVNTNYSAVHVPTNLYDRAHHVLDAIQWSEALNDVFLSNYESDPALLWQYFGSSYGFLRNFPAIEWIDAPDQFDCRMRPWYMEAATCSKDIIVLMDISGSMRGMRMRIAKLTVQNLLDTLSNNDFVNVFAFADNIEEVLPCFEDVLVQASPENIDAFKEVVDEQEPEGHANFSVAFTRAFQLLEKYREIRGCNETGTGEIQCNQAIMLVTDGVPHNITEVFEEYNWFDNGTSIPVRVFSYLIGREVFQVREIQWVACLNRGYYQHIHTLNEVREGVFTYVPVLARPLVLQGSLHPVTWSSVYSDTTDPKMDEWLLKVMENKEQKDRLTKYERNKKLYFSQSQADKKYIKELVKEEDELEGTIRQREYHLIITVSMSAYDRRSGSANYTNTADLLGVVGTDILVDHIKTMTMPYKIGVNGYAFIVNNNGFLILHPDLRPVSNFKLKENMNSVDLTEVEFIDSDEEFRDPSSEILQLRAAMANHEEGEMLDLRMKSHFDEMRRVSVEDRDYYYAPLTGTPFTLGLSLPNNYGYHQLKVRQDEVKYTMWEAPVGSLFKGYDWKVRPDWVYCRYHHDLKERHSFDSAEKELRHFLDKMASPDWKWSPQYVKGKTVDSLKYTFEQDTDEETEFINCDRTPLDVDDYYCERDLVQALVFDAKVTSHGFDSSIPWEYKDEEERDLLNSYNATLRFVATHSGLTRWQYMLESDERFYRRTEFGNLHKLTIDEPWYKAAVLQHQTDPNSVVYSLSFDRFGILEEDAFVTGSYAVFPREAGMEAPASVVGLQFRQASLAQQFFEHTSNSKCPECPEQCESEELDCYVLDSDGYILVSEKLNDTGLFFGEIDGAVMEAMVEENIYKRSIMFDYQALCFEERLKEKGAAVSLFTPFQHLHWFIQWLVGEMTWLVFQTNLQELWPVVEGIKSDFKSWYDDDEFAEYYDSAEDKKEEEAAAVNQTVTPGVEVIEEDEYETIHHPCDQKIELFSLDQEYVKQLPKDGFHSGEHNCSRPFHVRHIPHSNLLLVVVEALYDKCEDYLSTNPVEVIVNETHFACQKIYINNLPRRKLSGCFTSYPGEENIKECGDKGCHTTISFWSLIVCLLLAITNIVRNC